jgi:hypothetical protein
LAALLQFQCQLRRSDPSKIKSGIKNLFMIIKIGVS